MSIFPTQYSTLSAEGIKNYISKSYGFSEVSCRFLLHGISDTYLLTSESGKYIIKIYRAAHRSLEEIKAEVELLEILRDKGSKVAYPVKAPYGRIIHEFHAAEGTRYGVVYSFAPGKMLHHFTDVQLRIIGREMAFIHNVTAGLELRHKRLEYNIYTTILQPLEVLEPMFTEFDQLQDYAWLRETATKVINSLERLPLANFSFGYCHYDIFPTNFFFDSDNFTLFDFDFSGKGFLANDLAPLFVHFFFDMIYKGMPMQDAKNSFNTIVAGYRELRPISDTEVSSVPLLGFMLVLYYLKIQYINFDDWSSPFFNPVFVAARISALRKYEELFLQNSEKISS